MILDRVLVPFRRGAVAAPPPESDYWYTPLGLPASSGVPVTADTALAVSAVYACVRVLSETVASLPLHLYRRLAGGGKERAVEHPIYRLLHDAPNRWQTSFEFREMLMGHLALRGNAYARIVMTPDGGAGELWPIHPDWIRLVDLRSGNDYAYQVRQRDGTWLTYEREQILHVRGLSNDGRTGISPIEYERESIGNAIASDRYAGSMFKNSTRPSGVLEHPAQLSDKAKIALREDWPRYYGGSENVGKTIVLEEGMKWQAVGMTGEDAQFIEQRNYNVTDIARIFRVPPHMIGDLTRATFSNIEQQNIDFTVHCIRPQLVRIEQAMNRALLDDDEDLFVEHLVDGLLRGDAQGRAAALQIQFMNGALSPDEWREIENRNPLPDGIGQQFFRPQNLAPLDQEEEPEPQPVPMPFVPRQPEKETEPEAPEEEEAAAFVAQEPEQPAAPEPSPVIEQTPVPQTVSDVPAQRIEVTGPAGPQPETAGRAEIFAPLIADAAGRLYAREIRELDTRLHKPLEAGHMRQWVAKFYRGHREYIAQTVKPLLSAWQTAGGTCGVNAELGILKALGVEPEEALQAASDVPDAVATLKAAGPERVAAAIRSVLN